MEKKHLFDQVINREVVIIENKKEKKKIIKNFLSKCNNEVSALDEDLCELCVVTHEVRGVRNLSDEELIILLKKQFDHPLNNNKILFDTIFNKNFFQTEKIKELRKTILELEKTIVELEKNIDKFNTMNFFQKIKFFFKNL